MRIFLPFASLLLCLLVTGPSLFASPGDENWDPNFAPPPGLNGDVYCSTTIGNDLYVGGFFTKAGNVQANSIARWDGKEWHAVGNGVNGTIYALTAQGKDLYIGGAFTLQDGLTATTNVAKWNGKSWENLGEGIPAQTDFPFPRPQIVYALAMQGRNLVAAGRFQTAGKTNAAGVALWDGANWSALGNGIGVAIHQPYLYSTPVYALATHGSEIYAGGAFPVAGDEECINLAKWDGKAWHEVGGGVTGGPLSYCCRANSSQLFSGTILSLIFKGDELIVGGNFGQAGTVPAQNLASWNGTRWRSLRNGEFYYDIIYSVLPHENDLYIAGLFSTPGRPSNYIARISNGNWTALPGGVYGEIRSLCFTGKSLFAGGEFALAGNSKAGSIARWDGETWSALGEGVGNSLQGFVWGITASPTEIFVYGDLFSAGKFATKSIVKLNGTNWTPLPLDTNSISTITQVQRVGSNLCLGGYFT
ncbi:MAG TPA: hypothetical protein VGE41_08080, partial [Verrucomicrobiae bacterium]